MGKHTCARVHGRSSATAGDMHAPWAAACKCMGAQHMMAGCTFPGTVRLPVCVCYSVHDSPHPSSAQPPHGHYRLGRVPEQHTHSSTQRSRRSSGSSNSTQPPPAAAPAARSRPQQQPQQQLQCAPSSSSSSSCTAPPAAARSPPPNRTHAALATQMGLNPINYTVGAASGAAPSGGTTPTAARCAGYMARGHTRLQRLPGVARYGSAAHGQTYTH